MRCIGGSSSQIPRKKKFYRTRTMKTTLFFSQTNWQFKKVTFEKYRLAQTALIKRYLISTTYPSSLAHCLSNASNVKAFQV